MTLVLSNYGGLLVRRSTFGSSIFVYSFRVNNLLIGSVVKAWCMVWCGVVWCGVVWCGVVWCGVVWWVGACVRACVRACVHACVCVCM